MNTSELEDWISLKYEGLKVIDTYGERSFFYNPDDFLPNGVYFSTIKTSNGPNDKASKLDRDLVYRFSFGIGKKNFVELFGDVPKRPAKGDIVDMDVKFEELNILTPHPIYSWISWVCILSPTIDSIGELEYLLDFAYQKASKSYNQKMRKAAAKNG